MTEPFWKSGRWLPVILLMLGLLWGGCRSVEPVYQDVPAESGTGDPDPYADTHIYQVGELVKFIYHGTNGAPTYGEERINEEGILTLPGIGSVEAAGKTPNELQKELQKKYPRYFGYPEHDRVYYVGGEVNQPGARAYIGETTVSMAIQGAGDFTKAANKRKVKLIRSDGRREIITDLLRLHSGHDPEVYPGDRIEVSRKWWR